jgi:hypothetical protein
MAPGRNWITMSATFASMVYSPAVYAEAGDCVGFRSVGPDASISLGVVSKSTPRLNFIKNASAQKGCPSSIPACQESGYLVPGDRIIVSTIENGFVCADYVNTKGFARAGWLPRSAITLLPERRSLRLDSWIGQWKGGPEQSISIKTTPQPGAVRVRGEASFGAFEPSARSPEALVSTGEIDAVLTPTGNILAFTMGNGTTLPYDQGDEYDCRVRMRLLGSFMLVEDNRKCGGINVSFSGAYRRKK